MLKARAKKTSYMEGDREDVWIRKGNIYDLELIYLFTDEAGDEHSILFEDFNKYFEEVIVEQTRHASGKKTINIHPLENTLDIMMDAEKLEKLIIPIKSEQMRGNR